MKLLHDSPLTLIEVEVDDNEQALLTAYRAIKEFQNKIASSTYTSSDSPLRAVPSIDNDAILAQLTPDIDVMAEPKPEVDADGQVWTKGTHSATKRKDKNGRWVKARGVATDDRVLANASRPVAMSEPIAVPETKPAAIPTPPPAPVAPPPPPSVNLYDKLLDILRQRVANANFSPSHITQIFANHGVQNVTQLQNDEVKLAAVIAELESTL